MSATRIPLGVPAFVSVLAFASVVSSARAGTVLTLPASGLGAVTGAGLAVTNSANNLGGSSPQPFGIEGIATGKQAGGVLGRATKTGSVGVYGLDSGSGYGGYFLLNGPAAITGDSALVALNAGGSETINGPYGNAGFFEIGNTRNTDTALFVETFGNGTAFHAETHGAETASAAEGYDYSSLGGTGVFGYSLVGTAAKFIHGSGGNNSCSYDGASSGWNCTSSAATMEHRAAVDFDAVLDRLDSMPIAYFTTSGAALPVREIGPSAEDFRAAFGLGRDAEHIAEGNASGVALAAAKGLYRKLAADEAELAAQRQEIAALQQALAAQRRAIAGLARAVAMSGPGAAVPAAQPVAEPISGGRVVRP